MALLTGFNDPMLVTVVQRALAQNLDLAAAFARVQQARAAASAAGAQLLPTVDFDATGTAQHQSLLSPFGTLARTFPGHSRDQREYNVGAVASWEIDLAGGLRRSAAAARDEVEAAEAEQLGTSGMPRSLRRCRDITVLYFHTVLRKRRWSIWSGFTEQDRQTLEWLRRHVGDAAIAAAVERCAGSGKPYLSSVCRQLGVKTPGFHLPRRESPSPVAEQSLAAIRGILAARTASTDVDGRESGRFTLVAQPADVAATAALKEALPSMNANPAASHGV